MRLQSILPAALVIAISAAPALAAVVNFDDLDASAGDVSLEAISPYQGFTWTNFFAYTSAPGFPGFNNGIVSQPNAAFTGGDALGASIIGSITAAAPFDFGNASIGAGWYDNLDVTVEGRLAGALQFSQTITVDAQSMQLFSFAFTGIDELDFFSTVTASTTDPFGCGPSGCSQITFDNMNFPGAGPPPPAPEPSAAVVLLSSLSVFAMAAYRFGRRR
jgi:hypothetical protein